MLLHVRHRTAYAYEPAAKRVALRLKLFPTDTSSQTVKSWAVTINGEPHDTRITNGYGDDEAIWMGDRTPAVEVIAEGLIETRNCDGLLRNWKMAARPAMFLRPTPLTEPDDQIRDLAAGVAHIGSGLERAHALSTVVRDAIDYRPGVTTATTTAADALRQGAGVCQDHAHVLIAAARSLGAAARYVVGYLFVGDDTNGDLLHQAETHAWVEIWIDNLGWVGFDPSNRLCPTDQYIRIASGLDAPDAAPLRGAVTGAVDEALEAEVQVMQAQQ